MLWNDVITAGIGDRRNKGRSSFCVAKILGPNVRYGSKADIAAWPADVCFPPGNGHNYLRYTSYLWFTTAQAAF